MPGILGACVSENVSHLDERWMGCLPHHLSTCMRYVYADINTKASTYRNNQIDLTKYSSQQHRSTPPTSISTMNSHTNDTIVINLENIMSDFSNLKNLISFSSILQKIYILLPGYSLIQEIETRFGTNFDAVKMFLHSISHVLSLIFYNTFELLMLCTPKKRLIVDICGRIYI